MVVVVVTMMMMMNRRKAGTTPATNSATDTKTLVIKGPDITDTGVNVRSCEFLKMPKHYEDSVVRTPF
jgi:hypothetical protein